MARIAASVRTEVATTLASAEAELATFQADLVTAETAAAQARRRITRNEQQVSKLRDMLAWIDAVNVPTPATADDADEADAG